MMRFGLIPSLGRARGCQKPRCLWLVLLAGLGAIAPFLCGAAITATKEYVDRLHAAATNAIAAKADAVEIVTNAVLVSCDWHCVDDGKTWTPGSEHSWWYHTIRPLLSHPTLYWQDGAGYWELHSGSVVETNTASFAALELHFPTLEYSFIRTNEVWGVGIVTNRIQYVIWGQDDEDGRYWIDFKGGDE